MEYVEDMTWREFQLRLEGYRRHVKDKWIHTREIVYYTLVASGSLKKGMTKDNFMPLDGNSKSSLSDDQKELIKQQMKLALQAARKITV